MKKLKKITLGLAILGLLFTGCGLLKPVPGTNTETTYYIKDSTIVHVIDSIRIIEATHYRDMTWLGDTLEIEGNRSRMWAYADTLKEAVLGGLEEDEIEEKVRVVYKENTVYRDSLVTKEVPVEVEKIREVVPKWCWWSLGFNILTILGVALLILIKFRIL